MVQQLHDATQIFNRQILGAFKAGTPNVLVTAAAANANTNTHLYEAALCYLPASFSMSTFFRRDLSNIDGNSHTKHKKMLIIDCYLSN